MPLEEFREILLEHAVEISRFGTGGFKTLHQFYEDVVLTEKSYLQLVGENLRRFVELVRISLRFRAANGKQKELRIKSVMNPDGSVRERNLPLAMVLRPSDAGAWQPAVETCFEVKFGLKAEVQKLCFHIDDQAYSYEETIADSSTIPSIPTEIMRHVPGKEAEFQRRMSFYEQANWSAIEDLMRGAGLLTKQGHDFGRRLERTLAMLVLMTIHDIMKLDILRPTVLMNEFCGYKSGEVIGDHDIALSYVLERCPEALPSFAGLLPELQECIRFTHCKLDYNMGWLVQGEAHPGALFRAFRQVILERPKETSSKDVAFYFVHWFADLAGAEASPLTGCEKFVLKFPLHVLSSFIDSFPVVWKLGPLTETQVFEEYLIWRWENMPTSLGVRPSGTGAVAQMRLVLMAQGDSVEILRQFKQLPKSDANILTKDGTFRGRSGPHAFGELAITGCPGQSYSCDDSREVRGPAILVYYAPALMQKAGRKNPYGALRILAEVFRQARALWPLSDSDAEKTVLLRIDVLKELETADIMEPPSGIQFLLQRNSLYDGQVKIATHQELQDRNAATSQVLCFKTSASSLPLQKRRTSLRFMSSFLSFQANPGRDRS
eukprot:g2444.t1